MVFFKKTKFLALWMAAAFLLFPAAGAHATNKVSTASGSATGKKTSHNPYADETLDLTGKTGIVNLGMALIRDPMLPPENFILRISPHNRALSGCPQHKGFSYETNIAGDRMEVKLTGLAIDNSEYPRFKCNGKPQLMNADIVLNKAALMENNVKTLMVKSGPAIEMMDLWLSEEKIELAKQNCVPKEKRPCFDVLMPQKMYGRKDSMVLWFYPERTLMLYVPGASPGLHTAPVIDAFAREKGLRPITEVYPEFQSPLVGSEFRYYVDADRKLPDSVFSGDRQILGEVIVEREVFGLEANEIVPEPVQIYAKVPGMYD